MAYTTGSATDYHDLLAKLKDYLDAQGWTINLYQAAGSMTGKAKLYVTGPGSEGGQQPNVSIDTEARTSDNSYGWRVCAHTTYNADAPFGSQQSNSPIHYFNLHQNALDYFFYVSDRRFIVIAKIGVVYLSMYAGFFLPYALPEEYPFPYYVGATARELRPYSYANAACRSFCDPGQGSASYMRRVSLDWGTLNNDYWADNAFDNEAGYYGPVTWPYRNPTGYLPDNDDDFAKGLFKTMRPLKNGKMPIWQVQIVDSQARSFVGLLEGVFATGGFNRIAEQIVSYDSRDFKLFINVYRTRPKDFFAVEQI